MKTRYWCEEAHYVLLLADDETSVSTICVDTYGLRCQNRQGKKYESQVFPTCREAIRAWRNHASRVHDGITQKRHRGYTIYYGEGWRDDDER